jgi:uncharacterized protein (UPF0212 family)
MVKTKSEKQVLTCLVDENVSTVGQTKTVKMQIKASQIQIDAPDGEYETYEATVECPNCQNEVKIKYTMGNFTSIKEIVKYLTTSVVTAGIVWFVYSASLSKWIGIPLYILFGGLTALFVLLFLITLFNIKRKEETKEIVTDDHEFLSDFHDSLQNKEPPE